MLRNTVTIISESDNHFVVMNRCGHHIRLYSFVITYLLITTTINPLNAKFNPICHLLALLGAHHILHVSRIRVNVAVYLRAHQLKNLEPDVLHPWIYVAPTNEIKPSPIPIIYGRFLSNTSRKARTTILSWKKKRIVCHNKHVICHRLFKIPT